MELRDYLQQVNPPEHEALVALRARTAAIPFFGALQGTPSVGHLLRVLIQLIGARHVLELGAFTGCSTLAMAEGLPSGGRIVAIEADDKWPAIGQEFWHRSGHADRIDLCIGQAAGVLDALIDNGLAGTVDFVFVDVDKDAYDACFERSLVLLRQNGLIVFDNVLFGGLVLETDAARIREAHAHEPAFLQDTYVRFAESLKRFNERLASDARVDIAVLPLLDGVTLARKR